jgi:hypothetical protein
MELAADLRAQNVTWPAIASQLGYSDADSAQQNLTAYPSVWVKLFQTALEEHIKVSVEPSALEEQIAMMAFQNPKDLTGAAKVRQMAAHSLLAHSAKLRAQKVEVTAKRDPEALDQELMDRLLEASNVAALHQIEQARRRKLALEAGEQPADGIADGRTAPQASETP